jgi:hypothetical protein
VKTLVSRVRVRKEDPDGQITVAGLFGAPSAYPNARYRVFRRQPEGLDTDPICQSWGGEAWPGLRLARFIGSFGGGIEADLCAPELAREFGRIGRAMASRMASACVPAPVSECQVKAGALDLPGCSDPGLTPCWRLAPDATCAGSGTRLMLEGGGTLPARTVVQVSCPTGG